MNNQRKKFLALAGAMILIGILFLLVLNISKKHDPGYTKTYVSKDTGESVSVQPNKTPESTADTSNIPLLGSYLLLDNGATQAQYSEIKKALTAYSKDKLNNKYLFLTLVPSSFKSDAGEISSDVRLGDSSNIVKIHIKLWQLTHVRVNVEDPSGKFGGNYDSGDLETKT